MAVKGLSPPVSVCLFSYFPLYSAKTRTTHPGCFFLLFPYLYLPCSARRIGIEQGLTNACADKMHRCMQCSTECTVALLTPISHPLFAFAFGSDTWRLQASLFARVPFEKKVNRGKKILHRRIMPLLGKGRKKKRQQKVV